MTAPYQPDQHCPACAGDPPGHVCGFCGRGQSESYGAEIAGIIVIVLALAILAGVSMGVFLK